MRWPIFGMLAFTMLVLELGLRPLFVGDPNSMAGPSFVLILLVYVGFFTPAYVLAWAAIILGLLLDLSFAWPMTEGATVQTTEIIGPNALAFLVGAFILLKLRALVFRESPFTLAVMVFIVGICTGITAVMLLRLRSGMFGFAEPIENWSTAGELQVRFVQLLWTTALAIPCGWMLGKMRRAFGFNSGKSRY